MNKYVASGKSSTHLIEFIVDREFVSPSEATYSIYKNDGTVVGGLEDEEITVTEGATSVVLSVSNVVNTPTLPNEVRFIVVNFIYGGNGYQTSFHYFLRDSLFFPLTTSEVRAVLGAEIPDDYIDIYHAFDLVKQDTTVNLDNILSGGTVLLPALIDAVKYKAAIEAGVSVQTSIMQMEQADNTLYRRFEEIDFMGLQNDLKARYGAALDKLNGTTTSSLTAPLYSTLAVGTDPVTGQ